MLVNSVESFKTFVESCLPEEFGKVTSTGSGILIDSDLVLTASHVIEGNRIQKVVIGKKIYQAKVLKRFAENDVAIRMSQDWKVQMPMPIYFKFVQMAVGAYRAAEFLI